MINPALLLALAASVAAPQGDTTAPPRPLPEGNNTAIVRILPMDAVETTKINTPENTATKINTPENRTENKTEQNKSEQNNIRLDNTTLDNTARKHIGQDNTNTIPRPPKPAPKSMPLDSQNTRATLRNNTARTPNALILDEAATNYDSVSIQKTADNLYMQRKSMLDEKFSRMFEIKSELDGIQKQQGEKWDEYYALKNAYERQLKRLIAEWVMLQAQ